MQTLALCLVAFSYGCGAVDDPSTNDESSIQGGHVDSADPAVGLVWIKGGGFCTGTLIAPDVVLTAGHCVEPAVEGFYTGAGKLTSAVGVEPVAGMTRHAVIAQLSHPSYSAYGGCPNQTFDVGLIRLAQPVKNLKPLARAADAPAYSSSCRIVGYGVHDANGGVESFEQKRGANVWVKAVGETYVDLLWRTGISDHGDSGGPLLCDEKIAAVTSCHTDGNYPDHREAVHARVDNIGAWIDSVVKKWSAPSGS